MALIEEVNRLLESEESQRREVSGTPRKAEVSGGGMSGTGYTRLRFLPDSASGHKVLPSS
jgi:hypothetical protein